MEQHFGVKSYDSRDLVDFVKLGVTVPLYINRFVTPSIPKYKDYDPDVKVTRDPSEVNTKEYMEIVQAQVIENDERTERLAEKAREMVKAGSSCYVYYSKIAYGEKLCAAMDDMKPVMLQGSTPRQQRIDTFKAIEDKEQLLVVSDIGGYGLNIRSLDSIMIASPTKDARQLKGRVCRTSQKKKFGLVLDPVDIVPFLYRHADLRHKQYEKDGDVVIG
jgi:superfamily II DNA or RNA helicase